ncbi:MAG: peptidoglycan bridge formation glycyltransferase FemA/FemB family protein [Spirochaetaceae bacterium]|jgi:lipid II:glycine glycyltransferase (peptidoglycan interpeptide bridge formation enzyme)|nr:peptidoglycan bridge formation glycyltransferase FemA/FemB family protein [Spirochaetaceae bacterium]
MYLKNIQPCSAVVCDRAGSFLQSAFWAGFKAQFGWDMRPFRVELESGCCEEAAEAALPPFALMVLCRRLAPRISFAYIPWGPELKTVNFGGRPPPALLLREIAEAVLPQLPPDTAFLRIDPPWFVCEGADGWFLRYADMPAKESVCTEAAAAEWGNARAAAALDLRKGGWHRAFADIQAPDTVVLDIAAPVDAILAGMKSKWRYNVRLGTRKVRVTLAARGADFAAHLPEDAAPASAIIQSNSVTAPADSRRRKAAEDALAVFYALLCETACRDKIAAHSFGYYTTLFECAGNYAGNKIDIRLYLADFEGEAVAGIVTMLRGTESVYLYGASSSTHRELMAPYALQWQAIQDAKAAGALRYDLFGIPPDGSPNHPMAGLYRFKTGFGGSIVHRTGSWDYIYKKNIYLCFRCAEFLRKKIRDIKKSILRK